MLDLKIIFEEDDTLSQLSIMAELDDTTINRMREHYGN